MQSRMMSTIRKLRSVLANYQRDLTNDRNATRANQMDDHTSTGGQVLATSILYALPDPALILDSTAILLQGNAPAHDIFGVLRIGEHISRTTRNPELVTAITNVRQPGDRKSFEVVLHSPIERRLEGVATRLAVTPSTTGAPTILVILQDLSERDALARMRVEFVANASHELRTPLSVLTGFIETLSGPAKGDPVAQQRFLGIMAEQAARMTRLIDDLLALSRVEMRAHLAPTTTVDLNLVASDVVNQLMQVAANDKIQLVCKPLASSATIRGDHDELVQAVQNLVHNAIKYGRPEGTVSIVVTRGMSPRGRQPVIRLNVVDNGPGISADHVPRLTERFYRVNTASSREKGGTGLGLAIVKHIVTRHNGEIDITSKLGEGSTFSLSFPALEKGLS